MQFAWASRSRVETPGGMELGRLELTIIGNQGPYPGPGGACSGYLVRSQGATVLIDCGPGVMPRLQQHIDVSSLDAVVISHFHPDHYSDFLTMRYAFQYIESTGRMGCPVTLALPAVDAEWFLREIIGEDYKPLFRIIPIEHGSRLEIGGRVRGGDCGLVLDFRLMSHAIPSFGTIVYASQPEHGSRAPLAYTSDTGLCESLEEMAASSHTLLVEASMQEGDAQRSSAGHLAAAEAGRIASEHGVARVLLTHLHPAKLLERSVCEASEAYGGQVEIAAMGKTYVLREQLAEEMEDENEV